MSPESGVVQGTGSVFNTEIPKKKISTGVYAAQNPGLMKCARK